MTGVLYEFPFHFIKPIIASECSQSCLVILCNGSTNYELSGVFVICFSTTNNSGQPPSQEQDSEAVVENDKKAIYR